MAGITREALNKQINAEDKEGYAACAGVAIVHQKYPFYKAYELAERDPEERKRIREFGGARWIFAADLNVYCLLNVKFHIIDKISEVR